MALLLVSNGLTALAQPSGTPVNPNPGGGRNPSSEPETPIDQALIWLLVLGVAFGVYMIAKKKQQAKA